MTSALDPTVQPTTLRIPRTRNAGGTVLDWYYLEVRERGGLFDDFSLGDPALGGASVRVNDDPAWTTISKLLDTHPASGGSTNAPLAPGETFSDGQVTVTTVSAGAGNATVEITLPSGAAGTQAPSAPTGLSHTFTSGGAVRLAWNASSDNTGVSGYPVFRDGVQIATTGYTYYNDATGDGGSRVHGLCRRRREQSQRAASPPHTVVVPSPPSGAPGGGAEGGDSTSGFESHAGAGRRSGPVIRLRRKRARNGRLLFVVRVRDDGRCRTCSWTDGACAAATGHACATAGASARGATPWWSKPWMPRQLAVARGAPARAPRVLVPPLSGRRARRRLTRPSPLPIYTAQKALMRP